MAAVYGNLMVMGIAVALFYATVSMRQRSPGPPKSDGTPKAPVHTPRTQP